jgi:hypothetical protein
VVALSQETCGWQGSQLTLVCVIRHTEHRTRDLMVYNTSIDVTFDFRSDTSPGKDPDARSPTLPRYHQLLWSKPLPGGAIFDLVDITPRIYLHHRVPFGRVLVVE